MMSMRRHNRSRTAGFTMVELVMTLLVAAILSAMAAPSFFEALAKNGVVSRVKELRSSLDLARAEAISRNGPVIVCASSDQSTCDSDSWDTGWLVFFDADKSAAFSDGDIVLTTQVATNELVTLTGTMGVSIAFNRQGYVSLGSGDFTFCYRGEREGTEYLARGLTVLASGAVRTSRDSDGDGIYEDSTGENIVCP